MFTAMRKISKDKGAEPTEFEEAVAQSFFDLENTNQELKRELKDLYMMPCSKMLCILLRFVGKRNKYRLDGSKIIKIFLYPKERNNTEYKLETLAKVYRKLSGERCCV